jgi:hypothetical protein
MAFSQENQDWIKAQIREALYPNGFKKAANFLRYWGVLGVCVTAFVAIVAICVALGNALWNNVATEATFRGTTTQKLKDIDDQISAINSTLKVLAAQSTVARFSSLPPKELKSHEAEIQQVKSSLAKAANTTPGYWSTAFQTINLASKSASSLNFSKLLNTPESTISNVKGERIGGLKMGPARVVLSGHVEGVIIHDSIVRFDPNVVLVNDLFINCVFVLPPDLQLSSPVKEIVNTLLASDIKDVRLNAS